MKDIIALVNKAFEKGITYYAENLELRNSICQGSEIGLALDSVIANIANELHKKRLLEFIQMLNEEMLLVEKTKIDRSYLVTEEFFDLFMKIIDNSLKTRIKERVLLNCRILIGSIQIDKQDLRTYAEDFVSLISDLSPMDLKVGSEIYRRQKDQPAKFEMEEGKSELSFVNKSWQGIQTECSLTDDAFSLALAKLVRSGLIKEVTGSYVGYQGGQYIITSNFKTLMKLISYANEPIFSIRFETPMR